MKRVYSHGGFTLLELLIVISLMGVATGMGVEMFFKISDAWKRTTIQVDLNARADYVFDQMRRDFSEVVASELSGAHLRGTVQTAQDSRFFRIPLEDDQMTIPVELAVGADNRFQRVDVGYYIERSKGTHTLVRTMHAPGNEATGSKVEVAEGVLAMRIEYLDHEPGSPWKTGWLKPTLPRSVRVNLVLVDPQPVNVIEQIARKAVFPINVQ